MWNLKWPGFVFHFPTDQKFHKSVKFGTNVLLKLIFCHMKKLYSLLQCKIFTYMAGKFGWSIWSLGMWLISVNHFHKDTIISWYVWDLVVLTARNEKSGEKVKPEGPLFHETFSLSHSLLNSLFIGSVLHSFLFFHWQVFRLHKGQRVKKIESLPFQKCSIIPFPLRFSCKIPLIVS